MASAAIPMLAPDHDQARRFLEALGGGPDVSFTFQTYPDKKEDRENEARRYELTRVRNGTFAQHARELVSLNRRGAGVYVTINETDGKGRKAKNIVAASALWIDKDNGELGPLPEAEPSIRSQTKHGEQAIWLLRSGESLADVKPANAALATKLGADTDAIDIARVLRVPGFYHQKGDPFMVRLLHADGDVVYRIGELIERLDCTIEIPKPKPAPAATKPRQQGPSTPAKDRARAYLAKIPGAVEGAGGDAHTYGTACAMVRDFDLSDADALDLLLEWNQTCSPPWTVEELEEKIRRARKYGTHPAGAKLDEERPRAHTSAANDEPPDDDVPHSAETASGEDGEALILDPGSPYRTALRLKRDRYTIRGLPTLLHHRGEFFTWNGRAYSATDDDAIRAVVYDYLDGALRRDGKNLVDFKATRSRVSDANDALKAAANQPADKSAPRWLDGAPEDAPAPGEIVACSNGLLHLLTRKLLEHTPAFFNVNAVDIAYNPHVPDPPDWLRFLRDLWPGDEQAVRCLQEIFGYLLTPDTGQQKIFLLVGPKRSGKGTIARILTALLGAENVCAPTLASLGTNFGLQPLIGKRAAIIADARLGGKADQSAVAERLLSISGEDAVTVDRKFLPAWTGRLETRFVVLTNELPRLTDTSGALASRFVVLTLAQSFYGREDKGLSARLLAELPGILNWSLDGWASLEKRGHFLPPQSSEDAVRQLEDLSSPVGAFLRDWCEIGPAYEEPCSLMWAAWKGWCDDQGRKPGTAVMLGRDLHASVPSLTVTNKRDENSRSGRTRVYNGVRLVRTGTRTIPLHSDLAKSDREKEETSQPAREVRSSGTRTTAYHDEDSDDWGDA